MMLMKDQKYKERNFTLYRKLISSLYQVKKSIGIFSNKFIKRYLILP